MINVQNTNFFPDEFNVSAVSDVQIYKQSLNKFSKVIKELEKIIKIRII